MKPIILASTSPRRKELLDTIGIPYYCVSPNYEEDLNNVPSTESVSEYFALKKLQSVLPLVEDLYHDADIILSADTVITLNSKVLGKPKSILEATEYLNYLSGKTHLVETGIACQKRSSGEIITKVSTNKVSVKELTQDNIAWYLEKKEWVGAAGAYKIQGSFQRFISNIDGTQSSIMGLPLFEICSIFSLYNYDFS